MVALGEGMHMSITKLSSRRWWRAQTNDLAQVGSRLGGRRVITGMLTGPNAPLVAAPAEGGQTTGAGARTQK